MQHESLSRSRQAFFVANASGRRPLETSPRGANPPPDDLMAKLARHTARTMSDAARPWLLYLLECRNGSWYAGITNDLDRRFQAHLRGTGARYTRANPPLRILASRAYPDRASASRAEWRLKQLPKARKLAWLQDDATHTAAL